VQGNASRERFPSRIAVGTAYKGTWTRVKSQSSCQWGSGREELQTQMSIGRCRRISLITTDGNERSSGVCFLYHTQRFHRCHMAGRCTLARIFRCSMSHTALPCGSACAIESARACPCTPFQRCSRCSTSSCGSVTASSRISPVAMGRTHITHTSHASRLLSFSLSQHLLPPRSRN